VWAQDVWFAPQHQTIASINDAAKVLRAVQRNWVAYGEGHQRRLALLKESLPPIKARAWSFPSPLPDAALGAYTLLSRDRLLFSATRQSPFAHGEIEFAEDREGPPSRAYRKLWEVFTLLQQQPQHGERCVDMGASPGGWTWVLAKLGANVTSVDKAPLTPEVAALPNVHCVVGSAFAVRPEDYAQAPFDWFFSDVICYPARLLTMVQAWMAVGAAKRFVCTLKFQGETDHTTVAAFAAIPGSRLLHLAHNRHELTWLKL
jgi:23S rRNA (cytidine2498-2'-O)-methyltransferase